jgi:hypothetical protein
MQHDRFGSSNFGQFSMLEHCPYPAFYPLPIHPTLENEASGAHTLISGKYSTTTTFRLHNLLHVYKRSSFVEQPTALTESSLIASCANRRMSDSPTIQQYLHSSKLDPCQLTA